MFSVLGAPLDELDEIDLDGISLEANYSVTSTIIDEKKLGLYCIFLKQIRNNSG